tara:strand:+ start:1511 stop:1675 length:165 start_codon:yes stop_codon:yes gene_type:complete
MSQLSILKKEKHILWIKKTKKRIALIVRWKQMTIILFLQTVARYSDALNVMNHG